MAKIGSLWAGYLYGTNTGKLAADFTGAEDGTFKGILRVADDGQGVGVLDVEGTFDGSTMALKGAPATDPASVKIEATGALTPEGHIQGNWSSTSGAGGTFILLPHDPPGQIQTAQPQGPAPADAPPEQIYTATRLTGAVRLHGDDVWQLISFLATDFSRSRVAVTYNERGSQVSKYAADFEAEKDRLTDIKYLKLAISEPEAYGINRFASVELNANGENEVRTQGIQESWVIGKAEALASLLRTHEKFLVTSVRNSG